MKIPRLLSATLSAGLLALTGCQYVDTTPLATGNQVLNVTVGWSDGVTLPADASVTVLLLDVARDDLPLTSQSVAPPGAAPVALQLDYKAEDIQPPHRTRLEARVSVGGKLRFDSNRQKNFVTSANAAMPFALVVEPFGGATPSGTTTPTTGETYVVKAGDTGASIAQQLGTRLVNLALVNPGVDWTKLKIGQKLNLPDVSK